MWQRWNICSGKPLHLFILDNYQQKAYVHLVTFLHVVNLCAVLWCFPLLIISFLSSTVATSHSVLLRLSLLQHHQRFDVPSPIGTEHRRPTGSSLAIVAPNTAMCGVQGGHFCRHFSSYLAEDCRLVAVWSQAAGLDILPVSMITQVLLTYLVSVLFNEGSVGLKVLVLALVDEVYYSFSSKKQVISVVKNNFILLLWLTLHISSYMYQFLYILQRHC